MGRLLRGDHPGLQGHLIGSAPPNSAFDRRDVLDALTAEVDRLGGVLSGLQEADFNRPTRCRPWSVRDLVAHVLGAGDRLPEMLRAPEPDHPTVTAAQYYRPDARFAPEANATRIDVARSAAAAFERSADLVEALAEAWRAMTAAAAAEPESRVVRTRWDDDMWLTDFLVTRVVEIVVHGLDMADALGHPPWTTPPAAGVVRRLLLEAMSGEEVEAFRWDTVEFVQKATGRTPLTDDEAALLDDRTLGLAFG